MNISAPGKLVLAGEYAVLEGYPGLAMAVDRRVFLKSSPNLHHSRLWQALAQDSSRKPFFEVDSSALYQAGCKLGLGASAASAVCMAAFMNSDNVYEIALKGHKKFSGGLGSGIDIAASYYGGLIRFQNTQVLNLDPRQTAWRLVTVFTGQSQNTRSFVKVVLAGQKSKSYKLLMQEIGALTLEWEQFYTVGLDGIALKKLVETNLKLLRQLGDLAGIPILSAKQALLEQIAAKHGAFSKPSGAGGGDIVLCFVRPEQEEALRQSLITANFKALSLGYFAKGLEKNTNL